MHDPWLPAMASPPTPACALEVGALTAMPPAPAAACAPGSASAMPPGPTRAVLAGPALAMPKSPATAEALGMLCAASCPGSGVIWFGWIDQPRMDSWRVEASRVCFVRTSRSKFASPFTEFGKM